MSSASTRASPADDCRFATGAATARDDLVIITVRAGAEGFHICEEKSVRLALPTRRQSDVVRFMAELQRFFSETGITQLLVRGAQQSGPYQANARRITMEGMLLLVPGLTTVLAEPRSLAKWKSHSVDALPRASSELPIWEKDLLDEAILAACVASTGSPRPSWLCEMS